MVRDRHAADAIFGCNRDFDRALGGRVNEGVTHEVAKHLPQACVIAGYDHRTVGAQPDLALRRDDPRICDGVGGNGPKIDGIFRQWASLVQAGQEQHVVDQHAHPHRLLLDPAACLGGVVGRLGRAPAQTTWTGGCPD